MHKKLVLGAITNYTYHDVEPWLVSLKKTGYDGAIGLIVYNMQAEEVKKLEDKGVTIFASIRDEAGNLSYPTNPGFSIMIERFIHAWYFLGNLEDPPDYVLMTDVKDVIFQSDPFEKEFELSHMAIHVTHENMTYENEPWSANNMKKAFGPAIYESMKAEPIFCAGVIGGPYDMIRDLCLQIYLLCRGTPAQVEGGGGPDQAALNILLASQVWGSARDVYPHDTVHMGTTTLAIKAGSGDIGFDHVKNGTDFLDKFIEEDHVVIKDGVVVSDYDGPYAIVHQWNRVPELVPIVNRKYRE